MAFTYVTVTETYEVATDVPARGTVEFAPVDQMHNGITVVSATVSDDLDNAGTMSVRLAATTDPATRPVGVTYRVTEKIVGQPTRIYYVSVPYNQGSTLQLSSLPALSTGGTAGFALRNATDYDDSVAPTNGQAMVWDSTGGKFHPGTVAGGSGAVSSVNGQTGAVVVNPAGIGAQPVDSDLTAIAALAPTDGSLLERVGGVWTARAATQVKADLALDQVSNTTDANKPISTAVQTALNLKAPVASPTFTGTPTAPRFVGAVQTVAYATSITLDASAATVFRCTAAGDITTVAITNGVQGQEVKLQVFASGATRTVTAFGVGATVPSGTWATLQFTYNQSSDIWTVDTTPTSGGGSGAVSSVNGQTGAVTITASSLGAQPIDPDLTAVAALTPTDGSFLGRQAGAWTGRTPTQTKTDLALDQVSNTSDAAKPLSTAATTALAAKAPLASPTFTGTATSPRFVGVVQVVTYAASVTLDAASASTFRVAATGNLAIADITGGANGQEIALEVLASGADRTVTIGGATVTVSAGLWWVATLRYDQGIDTWKLTDSSGGPSSGGGGVPADASVTNAMVATNAAIDLDKTADSATRVAMTPAERSSVAGLASALALKAPVASPTFTGTATAPRFVAAVQTVTYAASLAFDASLAGGFRVTATGNVTVTNITNGVNGQDITLEVLASGGDRTVTFAGGGISTQVVPSGQWWLGRLRYNSTTDAWMLASGGSGAGISPTLAVAKGDLLVATAANTFARLPVGSPGQVLTPDPSTVTGLTWSNSAGSTAAAVDSGLIGSSTIA